MLLKALKVTNAKGSVLDLPLEVVSGGFFVKDISGLGPVKATLVSSSFASLDGEQYHSSKREARNIVVKLGLDPDHGLYSVYDLRAELYTFFMPKTRAKLSFHMFNKFSESILTQAFDVEIFGRIESFEVDLFTKEPSVDLSIMCFEPRFVDPEPVIFEGNSVTDLTETTLTYEGSEETGMIFEFEAHGAVPDLTVYHRPPDQSLKSLYFTEPMIAGDILTISTITGAKTVTLKRDGVEHGMLHRLSTQSNWLELMPGENVFRVYSEGTISPYTIEYTNKYGGL